MTTPPTSLPMPADRDKAVQEFEPIKDGLIGFFARYNLYDHEDIIGAADRLYRLLRAGAGDPLPCSYCKSLDWPMHLEED